MNFPYKALFASEAKVATPREEDEFLALASLENLRQVIPDVSESPDMLYIASDLFVAGMANKNGQAISLEDSINLAPTFINKFIDVEHKRDKITGSVLNYAFTEFGTSKPIENILDYKKPFNIALGGVIWKILYPNLVKHLIKSSDPAEESYKSISMSWEVGYKLFDIAIGSKIVSEAEIVTDEKLKKELFKYTKKGKGLGVKDGSPVYILIRPPALGLGAGLVMSPAAEVRGVLVDGFLEKGEAQTANASQEIEEKQNTNAILTRKGVNTFKMNTLEDLYKLLTQDKGEEACASAKSLIENAILEANKTWETKQAELEQEKIQAIAKEEEEVVKRKAAEDKLSDLGKKLSEVEQEMQELKSKLKTYEDEAQARAVEDRFNSRMSELDQAYDLNDKARKAVLKYVRDLADEDYASWKNETFEVLYEGKLKTAPKPESTEEALDEVVIASIEPENEIPNPDSNDQSILEKMKNAFGSDAFEVTNK